MGAVVPAAAHIEDDLFKTLEQKLAPAFSCAVHVVTDVLPPAMLKLPPAPFPSMFSRNSNAF
jgi:hypothetical protein